MLITLISLILFCFVLILLLVRKLFAILREIWWQKLQIFHKYYDKSDKAYQGQFFMRKNQPHLTPYVVQYWNEFISMEMESMWRFWNCFCVMVTPPATRDNDNVSFSAAIYCDVAIRCRPNEKSLRRKQCHSISQSSKKFTITSNVF